MGEWLRSNEEVPPEDYEHYMSDFTKCGNHIYFHVLENTIGAIPVQGIDRKRVRGIRSLSHGHELPIVTHFTYGDYPDVIFVDMGPSTMLEDDIDTVLDIELVD